MFNSVRHILMIGWLWGFCTTVCAELMDPTAPSNYAAETSSVKSSDVVTSYTLRAILISADKKFAVINENIVKVGDMLGDERVSSIDNYKVILVSNRGELELKLFDRPIKKEVEK